jgi:Spy/CpxP family protein refolding chaperone
MVEERFALQVKEQLGLTDDQAGRLRGAMAGIADKRRTMERQERALRQALNRQLRPGVAADADSVGRLVDVLTELRVAYAETFREEMREVAAILTPVQRGQYLLLRDRLIQRVQEIRQSRQGAAARTSPPPH